MDDESKNSVETLEEISKKLTKLLQVNATYTNQAISSLHVLAKSMNPSLQKVLTFDKIDRNDLVDIEIKCTFLKIGDINTRSQNFDAEVLLQAKWEDPALDFIERTQQQPDKPLYDPDKHWEPMLLISNVIGDFIIDQKTYTIKFSEPGYNHALVILMWRFKGKFKECLELEHFPFDVQDLTIQVCSDRSIEEIDIIADKHALSTVNINMFQDAQEWSIYQHVECVHRYTTWEHASCTIHPVLHIQSRVKRKVGFFVWNIIIIVLLILGLAFGTMSIDPNNPDRMATTVTLFLAAVTFKLVVSATLPTISYLTYLDIYILGTLVFLAMQSSESAVTCTLSVWLPIYEVVIWDEWTMASLGGVLIAFHLIFGYYIYSTALRKSREMKLKDREYAKKRDYLDHHGVLLTVGYSSLVVNED